MDSYEKAGTLSKNGNDDEKLRWNTCARIILEYHLRERPAEGYSPME